MLAIDGGARKTRFDGKICLQEGRETSMNFIFQRIRWISVTSLVLVMISMGLPLLTFRNRKQSSTSPLVGTLYSPFALRGGLRGGMDTDRESLSYGQEIRQSRLKRRVLLSRIEAYQSFLTTTPRTTGVQRRQRRMLNA